MRILTIWAILALAVASSQSTALAGNQEIAEQVATSLRDDGGLSGYRISVCFQNGTATLTGSVNSEQQIDLAVKIAGGVSGVKTVVNNLEIAHLPMMPAVFTERVLPKQPAPDTEAEAEGTVKVALLAPVGATVVWNSGKPGASNSKGMKCPTMFPVTDGRTYQLRFSEFPNGPHTELLANLEVRATTPKTAAFLKGNAIPVWFDEEDIERGKAGKTVTKVAYLPNSQPQGRALVGIETLTGAKMPSGKDPVAEANRRGAILAIMRIEQPSRSVGNAE